MQNRLALLTLIMAMLAGLVSPGAGAFVLQDEAPGDEQPAVDEIVVEGLRYQFDSTVTIDLGALTEGTTDDGTPVWSKGETDPLDARYIERNGEVVRYLPEQVGAPQPSCAATSVNVSTLEGGGIAYIPVGLEPDIAPEQLIEIGSTNDGRTLYAPSAEQPFNELYASGTEDGLVWYVARGDSGVPASFPDRMVFAGQTFELSQQEAPDRNTLQVVGCALRFPALADASETPGSLSAVHVEAWDTLVTYVATETAPPATPEPTQPMIEPVETATPQETIAPTQAPEPTLAPTLAPTATLVPTAVPTEAPTSTPEPTVAPTATTAPTAEPTATSEPTQTPTPEPTATTVPPATSEPTVAPPATEAPTATAPPTSTPEPTPTQQAEEGETPAPTSTPRPTPTPRPLAPQAIVPTVPPEAPPPAASTATATTCTGDTGPIGDDGRPERLPDQLQYGGTGYRYAEQVAISQVGELTRIGCVGPFEAFTGDDDAIYLTVSGIAELAWRYERTSSFTVDVEVSSDPRVLVLQGADDGEDVRYRASDPMVPSVYSSVSLVLYVSDAEATQPDRVLGHAISHGVFGEYLPEGEAEQASDDVLQRAESLGIHSSLTLGTGSQTYLLVSLWEPFGTTTNGWVTLFGPQDETAPEQLVGLDPRRLDLFVFDRRD